MGQTYHPTHSPILNQPRIRFILLLAAGLLAGWLTPVQYALGQAPAPGATAAESRVAPVIGNSAYQNTPALPNPKRDAQAIGEALKRVGFDVDLRIDVTKTIMDEALRRFGDRLEHAQVALFYYAGHGLQFNGVWSASTRISGDDN
jgi:L-alanine-DL-glutamate epimerase-like enolase superfamily enzyme